MNRKALTLIEILVVMVILGVVVTTPERGPEALNAASLIQDLLNRYPAPREREKDQVVQESVTLFKRYDFKGAGEMAKKGMN